MPDALKNIFNYDSIHMLAMNIKSAYPSFAVDEFIESTMDETWENLELKARIRKISTTLGKYLPSDYGKAIEILNKIVANSSGIVGICFPDFVEVYGQNEADWEISISALERYTEYSSSEFAVRPFIINHKERMMKQMYEWSKHENEHVRRLSSEGSRPQLPWGQNIVSFKKDPSPVLPILEQLKTDSSKYVQKSVANNLNDISKTHPELVAKLAKDWYGNNEHTDWIVKHGCRTLLKKGNSDVLAIFGFLNPSSLKISGISQSEKCISIGDDITFSFEISAEKPTKVRVEYAIDFVKSKGKRSRKIFQISEISLKKNEKKQYDKKHSFEDVSTRKHYPGIHSFTLIVNGVEQGTLDFELKQ